ncbi:MAG: methyltransferase domain-containing protein [Eubacteriales bacterium]
MNERLKTQYSHWLKEEAQAFAGWDFSYLDGRWQFEALPWAYKDWVKTYLSPALKLLDMGTGGGEILLGFNHPHKNTTVTEAYPPNIALIQKFLAPLGISVVPVKQDDLLPIADNVFDIVINRHESFDADEVFRVLKPGGVFITQQVGGQNNRVLSEFLIEDFKPPYPDWDATHAAKKLALSGFEVLEKKEAFPNLTFLDTGAVVYFAKIIAWEFPGFSVKACFEPLEAIERTIQETGHFVSKEHRFLLVAKKPDTKK